MRIIAGRWKGRQLAAPVGSVTRPTADRVRQALFDMLLHAHWGGRDLFNNATVLDGFAGTGALGLEALSRGAASCVFFEQDRAALACLRANIAASGAGAFARVMAADVLRPGRGAACNLIFLDPPYGQGLVQGSVHVLRAEGWCVPGTLVVAEVARDEAFLPDCPILAERHHGAARLVIWRE